MTDRMREEERFYQQVANVLRARILSADLSQLIVLEPERDLERIHGVSRTTVRKALDLLAREGLIERTQGRGTVAIPAGVERARRLRQSRTICAISPGHLAGIPMTYFGQIYQGVIAAVERAGYLLRSHGMQRDELIAVRHNLEPPGSDDILGVILLGIGNEHIVQAYADQDHPVVSIDYYALNSKVDSVVLDCFAEGQIAADCLLRQGHSQLFYLGHKYPNQQREPDGELMLAGIQRSLALVGLPTLLPERACFCQGMKSHILAVVDQFVALRPRPTGAIILSEDDAKVFVSALEERGVSCPQDISLITKTWEGSPCLLTCLVADARQLGEIAVRCLLDRAAGDRSIPVRLAVPTRLRLGRSVRSLR